MSRCQTLAVNEQVSVGVFLTDSQKKEARHTSPSSFLIPSILTFFLWTALNPPSEKHEVLNLFAPFLMDCFSPPFWDYAKVQPPPSGRGGELVSVCVCLVNYIKSIGLRFVPSCVFCMGE